MLWWDVFLDEDRAEALKLYNSEGFCKGTIMVMAGD